MTIEDVIALSELEKQCFTDAWSENMVRDLADRSWDEVERCSICKKGRCVAPCSY